MLIALNHRHVISFSQIPARSSGELHVDEGCLLVIVILPPLPGRMGYSTDREYPAGYRGGA
jgi:hypothetical protein